MNKKEKYPDLEIRRLETIYRTFVKMKPDERLRTINFLTSRYNDDLSKIKRPKNSYILNKKRGPKKKKHSQDVNNAKKYLKNEKTTKAKKRI